MICTKPMDVCTQARTDYAIAEKRFIQRWAGHPLRCFFFKKKYLVEKDRLFSLCEETWQICLMSVRQKVLEENSVDDGYGNP